MSKNRIEIVPRKITQVQLTTSKRELIFPNTAFPSVNSKYTARVWPFVSLLYGMQGVDDVSLQLDRCYPILRQLLSATTIETLFCSTNVFLF